MRRWKRRLGLGIEWGRIQGKRGGKGRGKGEGEGRGGVVKYREKLGEPGAEGDHISKNMADGGFRKQVEEAEEFQEEKRKTKGSEMKMTYSSMIMYMKSSSSMYS